MECFAQKKRNRTDMQYTLDSLMESIEREMKDMNYGDLVVLDHVAARLGNCARIITDLNDRGIKI